MAVTTRKTPIKYRRGKPIPKLAHGDVLDWTTFPLGSKPNGRRIGLCPKCGRKGELAHYPGTGFSKNTDRPTAPKGHSSYTHLERFESMWWMVLESCNVPDAE